MSYEDPQHWGDVDSRGNALDWTFRQSKLLYPGYEMLRKALIERCTVTSVAVPAVLQTARAPGRIYTGDWYINFHNTISTLITKFINHTDSGGNWDGQPQNTVPFAVWSEADILTEIGDAVRVPGPSIPLAAWSLQQYKILNLLLWITEGSDDPLFEQKKTGFGASYAIAGANFIASPWVDGFGHPFHRNSGYGVVTGGADFGFIRTRTKFRINETYAYAAQVDWYIQVSVSTQPGIVYTFDGESMGLVYDTIWRFQVDQDYLIGNTITSDYPTDREDLPPEAGAWPEKKARGWWHWTTGSAPPYVREAYAAIKFNVARGFKFV